jgi:hypothetical protein
VALFFLRWWRLLVLHRLWGRVALARRRVTLRGISTLLRVVTLVGIVWCRHFGRDVCVNVGVKFGGERERKMGKYKLDIMKWLPKTAGVRGGSDNQSL